MGRRRRRRRRCEHFGVNFGKLPTLEGVRWTVSDDPGALTLSAGLELGEEPVYLLADDLLAP